MKQIENVQVSSPERYTGAAALTEGELQSAFVQARDRIAAFMADFTDKVPGSNSVNHVYPAEDNWQWTSSFHTGMLWLCYEMTGDARFRAVADAQVKTFYDRLDSDERTATHDLGFLYSLSCVADYKLTGNEASKRAGVRAADLLLNRYRPVGKFIQAWGPVTDKPETYRLIIDCLLNLPLLYWASDVTGDAKYYAAAYNHLHTALENVVRSDASTYHTYYFDPVTGAPVRGTTHQGYSDDSCWARGQAWAIYGIAFSYHYTKDARLIGLYKKVTNYYLNHLPADFVPYWDLVFGDANGAGQPRDSSTASTAACGMLEMNRHLPDSDPDKAVYAGAVAQTLRSLISGYTTRDIPESNGLLIHGVYNLPSKMGVDECTIWGDYFYLEALVRMLRDWKMYW